MPLDDSKEVLAEPQTSSTSEIAEAVKARRHDHPALTRLRGRLIESRSDAGTAITSYDRMHHRHNRS